MAGMTIELSEYVIDAIANAVVKKMQEPCEDAISRQAVLDGIEELKKSPWATEKRGLGFEKLITEALEVVADLCVKQEPSVISQTRWIPVSERLPKPGEYVGDVDKYYLVQNEYGDMMVARYSYSEYWEQIFQTNPIADEIVAWMPLPEEFNAESEEV